MHHPTGVIHAVLGGLLALVVQTFAWAGTPMPLVAPGTKVEKLSGGFQFTEGPACSKDGTVFFSDIPNNRIHKWSTDGKLSTFRENSGGSNGLFFDKTGALLACEGKARQVTSTTKDGKVTVIVDRFEGKKFNSPNDLWVEPSGGIYFSDPRYGKGEPTELPGFFVFYISTDRKTVTRVIDDLVKPNGVVGTADGKTLYVADAGGQKIYRYAIEGAGKLAKRTLFAPSGSDGMTLDERGNVYLTSGTVAVYNPKGKKIASISVPERPANVCFGGKDRQTLFITARTGFYSLKMQVAGQ